MDEETRHYAEISKLMYDTPEERARKAETMGYTIDTQDEDRALFVPKDGEGRKAVIGFRGTDLTKDKRAWRDVLTDASLAFGVGKKTPRFLASEQFLIHAKDKGYKDTVLVGHSMGGSQSVQLAKLYGNEAHVYNPSFGIPSIVSSFKDRIFEGRKHGHIKINTTWSDPISIGSFLSVTGKVKRFKAKPHLPGHAIDNFLL